MAKPQTILAQRLFDFREVVRDRHIITTTVGPDLNPIVLSLGKTPDYRIEKANASFPKTKTSQLNDFQIHHFLEDQWFIVDIEATNENFHAVQLLGTDQWLLVRCRAHSSADRNAHVVDSFGRITHSFHAGDGIHDVQVTADSKIWCSFFDEGVFSDNEFGKNGLICLDVQGNALFDYGRIAAKTSSSIDDCYALNVNGNHETWLYYYSDFPLVQITGFQLKWSSRMPVSGSHAFAVNGKLALFFGSYKEKQTLFEVNLSNRRLRKLFAVTDDGSKIKALGAFGRAHHMYLVTEHSLFLVDWEG